MVFVGSFRVPQRSALKYSRVSAAASAPVNSMLGNYAGEMWRPGLGGFAVNVWQLIAQAVFIAGGNAELRPSPADAVALSVKLARRLVVGFEHTTP
jgi:hypothetical protein